MQKNFRSVKHIVKNIRHTKKQLKILLGVQNTFDNQTKRFLVNMVYWQQLVASCRVSFE